MRNAIMVGVSEAKNDLTPGRITEIRKRLDLNNIFSVYGTEKCCGGDLFKDNFCYWDLVNGIVDDKYMKHALDDKVLKKSIPYDFECLYLMIRDGNSRRDFETRKNLYVCLLKFWNSLVLDEKITDVFFAQVPHELPTYTLYIICKVYSLSMCMGDVLSVYDYEFPRRVFIQDIYYEDEWLKQKKMELDAYTCNTVELVPSMDKLYNSMQKQVEEKTDKTPFNSESRDAQVRRYFGDLGCRKLNLKEISSLFEAIKRIVAWAYHRIYADRKYKDPTLELISYYNSLSVKADFTKKFVYVPLHYSPECTSNPQGGNIYGEMVLILDILSEALPDDVMIYVKEHPSQTAFGRNKEFYDRCLRIKNVMLIDENTSIDDLLRNCLAVSTLTGTTGYEAQYYGKPFLMFGYYISRFAPGTLCVRTVEDCKKAFDIIINNQLTWDMQDIKRYLKFVEQVSYSENEISDYDFAEYVCNVLA